MANVAGLGNYPAALTVSLANRPPQQEYQRLSGVRPLAPGELADIVGNSSNHWRKLFNVYAKLLYALNARQAGWIAGDYGSWQGFRDGELLQVHSRQALLFTPPALHHKGLVIIAGKTWAHQMGLDFHWLDGHFALHKAHPWIVCPYFDYRQLSNARIDQLVDLIVSPSRERAPL